MCKIKPSAIKCPTGQWTPEAKQRFERLISSAQQLTLEVGHLSHCFQLAVFCLYVVVPNLITDELPATLHQLNVPFFVRLIY